MSALATLPSLSEDGWVKNSVQVADYLFSHFFISDYSQTYMYLDNVASFPYILQETQGNILQAATMTQQALSTYFSKYFNNVVAEVEEVPNLENPSKAQLSIYLKFSDSTGESFVLGRILQIANTKIERIIQINNGE